MAWSFQIGRLFGISVRLHITFVLLLGWLMLSGRQRGDFSSALLAAGVFACVLAHELGHSVVAQRYGVRVLDITLLPIGGLARMASNPRSPMHEFWIAAAGPAVNFVLAPLLFLAHRYLEAPVGEVDLWKSGGFVLGKLAWLNLQLGLFNLLPAFPMDGGRILRALLATRIPYERATGIASSLGQLLAFLMGFLGLTLPYPMLVLIAVFIFIGAGEEGARVQTQAAVEGSSVRDAMETEFHTLERGEPLGRAVELLLAGTQQDFPVMSGAEVVGLLTRRRLLEELATGGRDRYVSEVMEPSPRSVSPDTPLEEALEYLSQERLAVLPVVSESGLCGLLTTENAAEFVLIRSALRHSSARR